MLSVPVGIAFKGGQGNISGRPQIANPQLLGLTPLSKIRKSQIRDFYG
jgi:hypothetical protein